MVDRLLVALQQLIPAASPSSLPWGTGLSAYPEQPTSFRSAVPKSHSWSQWLQVLTICFRKDKCEPRLFKNKSISAYSILSMPSLPLPGPPVSQVLFCGGTETMKHILFTQMSEMLYLVLLVSMHTLLFLCIIFSLQSLHQREISPSNSSCIQIIFPIIYF